ncbi:MAG: DUF2141 domain-containing protein [Bacteroidales bacterium]|jgi:uncharacterized protein (DUF2141 family)|nr:DUF2141 domain-containing protein [Bacteroidales bacterium]
MKPGIFFSRFLVSLLFAVVTLSVKSQNVEVFFSGIRSENGQMIIRIFKDDNSFQKEIPWMEKKFKKANIVNGIMSVKFSLEPGVYGFGLVDDENSDGEMNFTFIGMPKEGFGFSNYYHSGLSRPKFDSFKFTLIKNQKIYMKIRYM